MFPFFFDVQKHLNYLSSFLYVVVTFFQALSGVGEDIKDRASVTKNTALTAALNTQFLFQIGVFTAVPMILGFILEQGFLRVCSHVFICMPYFLCQVIKTFLFPMYLYVN